MDINNITDEDKSKISELIKNPKNKKFRKYLKICIANNNELPEEFVKSLFDYYKEIRGKAEIAKKYFKKLEEKKEKQNAILRDIEKKEYSANKFSDKDIFSIKCKEGNYEKLDEIKELRGKTIVIYYDKILDQMVAQPLEYFEKKPKEEKIEIIEQTNNIHVEGHRFGNSKGTRNYLDDFLMEGDKKTFAILPAIKANIFQPKKTAEKECLKIAKFIENSLNLYKENTNKEYNKRIVLSGNSISNYTAVKIANYLNENGFIKKIKTDLRINQPAEGGFGPVQVNESDLDINKNIFDNLSSLIVSNGKFDNWNGFTAFHKKDIFLN